MKNFIKNVIIFTIILSLVEALIDFEAAVMLGIVLLLAIEKSKL